MKSLFKIIPILFLSMLIGCAVPIPFLMKQYEIGKTSEASVGSPVLRWASGMRRPNMNAKPYKIGYNEPIGSSVIVFHSMDEIDNGTGYLRELIYKGAVDDKMQCVYREYDLSEFGAFAKPTFFLDVTYDLKQSKVIAYQDFKIRVESADGQKVVFTILEEPPSMNEAKLRRSMER